MNITPNTLQRLVNERGVSRDGGLYLLAIASVASEPGDGRRATALENLAHAADRFLDVHELLSGMILVLSSEVSLPLPDESEISSGLLFERKDLRMIAAVLVDELGQEGVGVEDDGLVACLATILKVLLVLTTRWIMNEVIAAELPSQKRHNLIDALLRFELKRMRFDLTEFASGKYS